MKIKPQYIGKDINLPNLADQAVAYLNSKKCWSLYASGKAAIGRKSSAQVVRKILDDAGVDNDSANQFMRDVIQRLRTEQRANVKW